MDDKALGKQPLNMGQDKEAKKTDNPYARPYVGKCFRCNQQGHKSNECPTRKTINVLNQEEKDEINCEPDGSDKEGGNMN